MNIITNADVQKFLKLFKAGIDHGHKKELRNYTAVINDEKCFVSLEFSFNVDQALLDKIFKEEKIDISQYVSKQVKEMIDGNT